MKNRNIIFTARLYSIKRGLMLCFRLQIQVQSFASIAAKKSCVRQLSAQIAAALSMENPEKMPARNRRASAC